MQSKALRYGLGAILVTIILAGTFSAGLLIGMGTALKSELGPLAGIPLPQHATPLPDNLGGTPTELKDLFTPFWEAWNIVHADFVDQPVDDEAMMRGAIRGMMDSLGDQHTAYMDPVQFNQANDSLEGEYEGIGAYIDSSGDFLVIISPMPGSPAEKAGLRSGDEIIAIDGEDMTGIDPSEVHKKVLGPAGSTLTITVRREGEAEPLTFTLTRDTISMPSAEGEMLENDIAYVRVNTFGDKTTAQLRDALKTLMAQKPRGLVLDLRNNGGGYLPTAIEVVSEFVRSGVVMYEDYGSGERTTYEALRGGLATDISLVVLVNQGTASASEITAGAIQDDARGLLVGEVTYGKGSVQSWQELSGGQGAIRVTIARWLTPKERQINEIGLTPDVVVPLTEADMAAGRDPQLDKAVDLLTGS